MSKKGSLNLSIEAIVIVVIAFVVLGLGLGFVRSQFGDIQKTSTAVQEQISQQILDELRTGNKKLSFPASQLNLETSEESVQAIGIKNIGDTTVTLLVGFAVKGATNQFVSGEILAIEESDAVASILWDNDPQTLKPGESRVVPVTIRAPDKIGNYLYKVILYQLDNGGEIVGEPYDQKTFFIKTS